MGARPPSITTNAATLIQPGQFTANGSYEVHTQAPAMTERGFCYLQGTAGDPTVANSKVFETGSWGGLGSFALVIPNLLTGTSYRVRAYGINSDGIGYGTTITVTTDSVTVFPEWVSISYSDLTATSFRVNATVHAPDGANPVTRWGFCWFVGATGLPDLTDSSTAHDVYFENSYFGVNDVLEGLTPDTSYRVRAYAENADGTFWGEAITVTTFPLEPPLPPVIESTPLADSILDTSFNLNAAFSNPVNAPAATRWGFCYIPGTSGDPTVSDGILYEEFTLTANQFFWSANDYPLGHQPADWTRRATAWTINVGHDSRGKKCLHINSMQAARSVLYYTPPGVTWPADHQIVAHTDYPHDGIEGDNLGSPDFGPASRILNGDNAANLSTIVYPVTPRIHSTLNNQGRILEYIDGVAGGSAACAYPTPDYGRIRGEVVGSNAKANFWPEGQQEPAGWMAEYTALHLSAGDVGMFIYAPTHVRLYGFGVGINGDPAPTANGITDEDGIVGYTIPFSNAQPNTSYRIRAYAVNEDGVSYSTTITVTTTGDVGPKQYSLLQDLLAAAALKIAVGQDAAAGISLPVQSIADGLAKVSTGHSSAQDAKAAISDSIIITQDQLAGISSVEAWAFDARSSIANLIGLTQDARAGISSKWGGYQDILSSISSLFSVNHHAAAKIATLQGRSFDARSSIAGFIELTHDARAGISGRWAAYQDILSSISSLFNINYDAAAKIATLQSRSFDARSAIASLIGLTQDARSGISGKWGITHDAEASLSEIVVYFLRMDSMARIATAQTVLQDSHAGVASLYQADQDGAAGISSLFNARQDMRGGLSSLFEAIQDNRTGASMPWLAVCDGKSGISNLTTGIFDARAGISVSWDSLQDAFAAVSTPWHAIQENRVGVSMPLLAVCDVKSGVSNILSSIFDARTGISAPWNGLHDAFAAASMPWSILQDAEVKISEITGYYAVMDSIAKISLKTATSQDALAAASSIHSANQAARAGILTPWALQQAAQGAVSTTGIPIYYDLLAAISTARVGRHDGIAGISSLRSVLQDARAAAATPFELAQDAQTHISEIVGYYVVMDALAKIALRTDTRQDARGAISSLYDAVHDARTKAAGAVSVLHDASIPLSSAWVVLMDAGASFAVTYKARQDAAARAITPYVRIQDTRAAISEAIVFLEGSDGLATVSTALTLRSDCITGVATDYRQLMDLAAGISEVYAVIADGKAYVIEVDFIQKAQVKFKSAGSRTARLTSEGSRTAKIASEAQIKAAFKSNAITFIRIS